MNISITGADGFLGKAINQKLKINNIQVNQIVRKSKQKSNNIYEVGDITKFPDLKNILLKTDVLIHCIGVSNLKKKFDFLYEDINYEATKNIGKQAAKYNVKRLIYISSIKVYGENCKINEPFNSHSICKPYSKYAISKFKAETALLEISKKTNLEVVIIRSPLIYNRELKGNLLSLKKIINLNMPLPFKNINNKRSCIAIENLISFISVCSNYKKTPQAKNQIFSIADRNEISTTELILLISDLLKKKIRLFNFPNIFFKTIFYLLNKKLIYSSLYESLYTNCTKAKDLLNWEPEIKVEDIFNKNNTQV